MEKIFADTNIFGIAVDPEDDRRESVWEMMEKVSNGEFNLVISEMVLDEIEDNPHDLTREKEMDLVDVVVDEVLTVSDDALEFSDRLNAEIGLGIVDSQILATAVSNECVFWIED